MKPAESFYPSLVVFFPNTSKCICSVFLIVFINSVCGQVPDSLKITDSLLKYESLAGRTFPSRPLSVSKVLPGAGYSKSKVRIIAAANIAGYSAVMAGLYYSWYKDYPQGRFHTFNDFAEWKQMDKFGHVYSSYVAGRESMELWRWTGIDRKKRIWIGGMSGALYLTTIEILDGFSTEWGWSWGDFGANLLGSSLLVAQELAWDEQRIQLKWSFHRKRYKDESLNTRSNKLFGTSAAERSLKDYNGQTYWLSVSPSLFFKNSKIPLWIQLSAGTGAEGLFAARQNIGKDDSGNINFDRRDIKRYRQWYLAPDIDLTKIKTNKKGIRLALNLLNILKFPTPSLEYSNASLKWNWLTF